MEFTEHGIPIITLREKIAGLQYCMENDKPEDALGHLFDLIHHLAPGWSFGPFGSLQEIADHYGEHPAPLKREGP